jgi:hypothetical protein
VCNGQFQNIKTVILHFNVRGMPEIQYKYAGMKKRNREPQEHPNTVEGTNIQQRNDIAAFGFKQHFMWMIPNI